MVESISSQQKVSGNNTTQTTKTKKVQQSTKQPIFDGSSTVTAQNKKYSSVSVTREDGTVETTKEDGTKVITNEKNHYTKTINPDGSSVEQKDKKITYRDSDNKITKIITEENGKEVRVEFEYTDNKTIARKYDGTNEDAKVTKITVSEQKDGHKISSIYGSEEDMKNNKLSERIIDIDNPTTMKTEKYSYDENGNIKIVTTDTSGKTTTKYTDSKGNEIKETDFKEKPTEEPTTEDGKTHTVAKGETIHQMVTDALKAQGIDSPTEEQIKAAKRAFLEENSDQVQTYKGSKKAWKGNKFFLPNAVVKFPDFKKVITGEKTKTETTEKTEKTDKTDKTDKIDNKKITEEQRAAIQKQLGDNYVVEIDKDGKIVVKDKKGNILPEMTKMANDNSTDDEDIDKMMSMDKNKNKQLELAEYSKFISNMLETSGLELKGEDAVKAQKLIHESFKNLDTNKNGGVDRNELQAKAKEVIQKLTDDISKI